MKYIATIFDEKEQEHAIEFTVRGGASNRTIFQRTVENVAAYLRKNKMASGDIRYTIELPNWSNGFFGFICVSGYTVYLECPGHGVLAN